MKKAYALYGKGGSGKTSTLNLLIDLLTIQSTGISFPLHNEEKIKMDNTTIINYRGKIVGIGTRGDNKEEVEKNCRLFKDGNCDIIFTATRTREGSCDAIKEFTTLNIFSLKWIKKRYSELNRYNNNLNQAKELFEMI